MDVAPEDTAHHGPKTMAGTDGNGLRGQVFHNPLYVSKEVRESRGAKRTGRGNRLSYFNEVLGVKCKQATALAAIFISALPVVVTLVVFKQTGTVLGKIALGLIFGVAGWSFVNMQVVNMYEESKGFRKSRFPVIPTFFGLPIYIFLLVFNHLPTDSLPNQASQAEVLVPHIDTDNCTVITANREWGSNCMKALGPKGAAISHLSFDVSLKGLNRLETLAVYDYMYTTITTQMRLTYSSEDAECFDFLFDMSCATIFSTCNSKCNPIPVCKDRCTKFHKLCPRKTQSKIELYFDMIRNINDNSNTLHNLFKPGVEQVRKSQNVASLDDMFDLIAEMINLAEREYRTVLKNECRSVETPQCIDVPQFKVTPSQGLEDHTSHCSKQSIKSYVTEVDELGRDAAAAKKGQVSIDGFVFWYLIVLASLSAGFAVCRIRYVAGLDTRKNKTVGVVPFTQLSRKDKVHLSITAFVCSAVLFSGALHAVSQELLLKQEAPANRSAGYVSIMVFYGVSMFAFVLTVIQVSSIVRGLTFRIKKLAGNKNTDGKTKRTCEQFYQLYTFYRSMFGLRYGKYFFVKQVAMELFEIVLQVLCFYDVCTTANHQYVFLYLTLMFFNIIISPAVMMMRKRYNREFSKMMVYTVDGLMDMMYFGINLWRGGETRTEVETRPFVNLAIAWPIISITLKMRSIHQVVILKGKQKKSLHGISLNILKVKNSLESKPIQCLIKLRNRFDKIEARAGMMLSLVGAVWVGIIAVPLMVEYKRCAGEFGENLWQSASPKRMFKNSGNPYVPSCGYAYIETINADFVDSAGHQRWSKKMSALPKQIGNCTLLKELHVNDHAIATLPKSFLYLKNVERMTFQNNPVSRELDLSYYSITGEFPQKILCDHFYEYLEVLNVSGNSIDSIAPCIGKFAKLSRLDLAHNIISPDGLPNEIVELSGRVRFHGNPIVDHLSLTDLAGQKLKTAIFVFVKNNFPTSEMKVLDFSGCNFEKDSRDGGMIVFQILDMFPNLEILNVSKTKISNLFGVNSSSRSGGNFLLEPYMRWPRLKILDLGENEKLELIDSVVAGYIEYRPDLDVRITGQIKVTVLSLSAQSNGRNVPQRLLQMPAVQNSVVNLHMYKRYDWKNLTFSLFCGLTKLSYLVIDELSMNAIASIPLCFSNFRVLTLLKTSVQHFQWNWPTYFWDYKYLKIDFNGKTFGLIPFEKVTNSTLDILVLINFSPTSNYAMPSLASSVFPYLTKFYMYKAGLHGAIDAFTSRTLEEISVYQNSLSGHLPYDLFARNAKLVTLLLHWNSGLNGTFPAIPSTREMPIKCVFLHGTGISGPVPRGYLNISGILTIPATTSEFQLHNLTNHIDGKCSNGYCDYGQMRCSTVYFGFKGRHAKNASSGLYTYKTFLCYHGGGGEKNECGEKNGETWELVEEYAYASSYTR
eukprot:g9021.t1